MLNECDAVIPDAARFRSAGRGITRPVPGRSTVPYWITAAAQGRRAVEGIAAYKADIVKIWGRLAGQRVQETVDFRATGIGQLAPTPK
jgi:hypothetical protein